IQAQHDGASRDESSHQQAQQDETGVTATPHRPVQHAMVDLKLRFVAQSHHPQRAGDGSFSGSQNRSQQQDLCASPNSIEKQWGECLEAIPAWVVSLGRLYETVEAKPGLFDVAIVDEASQCWLDSLVLFYLAKQVIVV